jgi:hypothetical protein
LYGKKENENSSSKEEEKVIRPDIVHLLRTILLRIIANGRPDE